MLRWYRALPSSFSFLWHYVVLPSRRYFCVHPSVFVVIYYLVSPSSLCMDIKGAFMQSLIKSMLPLLGHALSLRQRKHISWSGPLGFGGLRSTYGLSQRRGVYFAIHRLSSQVSMGSQRNCRASHSSFSLDCFTSCSMTPVEPSSLIFFPYGYSYGISEVV